MNVEVHDTGIGVAPEQLRAIFDPFTQLHEGATSAAGGLGLGLSLVRSLTELHGGTVHATSPGPRSRQLFHGSVAGSFPVHGIEQPRHGGGGVTPASSLEE